ncbi:uncharacterized protein BCR38DRAFT_509234 [Pseudomassariella vexata]|uniref:Uncharacterized protein n=1 Tax=Pseudomassariella vexata TaxID=1141098 RepID=A0A1Y2E637_9PEZI|nr:uncharacterized protein BCR38DRAFT_509234 [Pseudomassariella vexata]ORY66969.1 hypothetical protein BCR38DRAFT_509234 [Pseudomassariella vexata]
MDDPTALELLYQPIILENALNRVIKQYRDVSGESRDSEGLSAFISGRISILRQQARTVTAIAILQGHEHTIYVVASNHRSVEELQKVKVFLARLLGLIHKNPNELQRKPLTKQIIWRILSFNFPRVKAYLDNLLRHLDACIADCKRREQSQSTSELEKELRMLYSRADFTKDITSENDKQKFLSDCETLLKSIHANKENRIGEAILKKSNNRAMLSSESWCELRHYLGRLLSYRQAAEVIVAAYERWPELFQKFAIIPVPSSTKMAKPISNPELSAADIVRNLLWEDEDPEPYLQQAADMQAIGLDDEIRQQINKKSFRPIVHAEVQLHSALIRQGIVHPRQFWNRYKYIGSSKQTCRLCWYYFCAHGDEMQVRPTHRNIYLNWRLPDVYKSQGPSEVRTRRQLLERLTDHVRKDTKRTLDEKLPSRRKHDSTDQSRVPSFFNPSTDDLSILSDLVSETSRRYANLNLGDSDNQEMVNDNSSWSLVVGEDGFDNEEQEGGASIINE